MTEDVENIAPVDERAHAVDLFRQMLLIRRFEEKCAELYSAGRIRGFLHLYIGEEAVAVGAMQALAPDDAVVATYREHGQALARGLSANRVMAEMYGKQEGSSRGRGGSMHIFDRDARFYGGNAIVGGGLPIAVGLALADALTGRPRVTACVFGDGAVAEGEFHEALNLAALWKLPVLFLCENNLYAMGTRIERALSVVDLPLKARACGVAAGSVDGMDVEAVETAVRRAAGEVRRGGGPRFLECRTYRFRAHSMFDAELYRDKAEVEEWKKRDPIVTFAAGLRARRLLDEADARTIDAETAAEVAAAVAFAEAGTWEPVEELTRDVYTPRGAAAPPPPAEARPPAADQSASRLDAGSRPEMRRMTYRDAVRAAVRDALLRDPRVFLMGEDVGRYGGAYAVSKGLLEEFGPDRIRDTPLSESGFVGAGIGAALGGLRPIVEVMTVNFCLLALDQIVNNAATIRHMSGGQFSIPLVIRMATGAGRQLAAQHAHSLEGWLAHIPGLRIVAPATIEDARGMLWTAIDDPDPVLVFEHQTLYNMEGELAEAAGPVDIDRARVRRDGSDASVVTYGATLHKALAAADELAREGISAEVIDLRTLRPLDIETIAASVRKTRRAVIVDEGWRSGSLSAEIAARIGETLFYELDAPIARVCTAEVPIPYPKHLEEAAVPQPDTIAAAVRALLGRRDG
jgi:pyruvate dehydrogenase E1 component beta subunit/2-oxoisovalerate dehydrogenase E1 component